jgi:hypothetical protein
MSLNSAAAVTVPLHRVAHARAGDKGNCLNISVIPYHDAAYAPLCVQLTESAIVTRFTHRGVTQVRRYCLDNIKALNFVIDDVLEGGVNGSLSLDGHGKTLSYWVLAMPVIVPPQCIVDLAPD